MAVTMTSMFRSEEMTLCQLFLQAESAYACVSELGELGLAEFRDLNPDVNAFQRKFVNEVRRCEEMERKLRFLQNEIDKVDIYVEESSEHLEAPHPREMIDLEAQFEQLENEMKDSNLNYHSLRRSFLDLTELKHVLYRTQAILSQDGDVETCERIITESQLGFVTGVITRDKISSFERVMWRACTGNVFFKYADIEDLLEDPESGEMLYKCVFHVFFQGEQLKMRVNKICEGFRATLYPCPETAAERREMSLGVNTRLEDLKSVIAQTEEHRHRLLQNVAVNINTWCIKVKKIKAIYHTMNMFNLDVHQSPIAECWVPVADIDSIRLALRRGTENSGASVPSILNRVKSTCTHPTFNRTNKFTSGFQAIIDAYGVADYQEVNPTLYTIITFPFLFSVMFGDFGHGTIMAVFALMLILKERQLSKTKAGGQIFNTIFSGRYIIFLMGVFSIYSGLLYNDGFSKSINIFGTGWVNINFTLNKPDYNISFLKDRPATTPIMFNPQDTARKTPYYFGIDPMWQLATNKLTFTNSLKMKLSIILGVLHMIFGVILSIYNHLHFKERINIWCEFIPQLLFISCIFGYLVILIFYKWIFFNVTNLQQQSLLTGLINMFLKFGSPIPKEKEVYTGQFHVQTFLVVIAVLAVPWMLFIKPCYLRYQHRKSRFGFSNFENAEIVVSDDFHEEQEEEQFDFAEEFIHTAIHTIEYCLGCISNTASYLRLWALSLAHAQLSEVLWTMVFHMAFTMQGPGGMIITVFVFAAWAVLTIAVLLIMEGLSAFLHTLRLHWVEFNSKFYKGQGSIFQPFSFKVIMSEEQI